MGGQNKNRWVLWYIIVQALLKYKFVTLRFIIPGHTRNRCDGGFGLVMQHLKSRNVNCPDDMMNVLSNCLNTSTVVVSAAVTWTAWNALLDPLFFILSDIKINAFYIYQARQKSPGLLCAIRYLDSQHWKSFNVLKKYKSVNDVIQATSAVIGNTTKLPIRALNEVRLTDKKTHEQYLIDEVCHRYHNGDD